MPIRIRRASPADEAAIDQWQQNMENLEEYLALKDGLVRDVDVLRQRYLEWLRLPREMKVPPGWERIDLVAVDDSGAICGYAVLQFGVPDKLTGQQEGIITEVHVWPDFRDRGVAKGLLEMAEAYAIQRGVPYLTVQVPAHMTGAVNLYKTVGYQEETVKMTKRVGRQQ